RRRCGHDRRRAPRRPAARPRAASRRVVAGGGVHDAHRRRGGVRRRRPPPARADPRRGAGVSATVTPTAAAAPARAARRTAGAQRFGDVLEAERIKFWSVRSTPWSLLALVVVGAGFTTLTCWANAEWLAGPDAGDPPTA